ncbi:MAG TPA: hypothetical protein VE596_14250 [Gaiellaceae bacterium]|nr:hypothetical protein [Gaiellaceae bacterium]
MNDTSLSMSVGHRRPSVDVLEPRLRSERVLDLLRGAAQGDDLTRAPEPAVSDLRKTIARIRLDVELVETREPPLGFLLEVERLLAAS